MNGGICVMEGNGFSCDCDGTGYGGLTCTTAIIYFTYIPPITEGTSIPITLSTIANLDEIVKISAKVVGPNFKRSTVLTLSSAHKTDSETVVGNAGIVTISLPANTDQYMYEPQQRDVFISSGSRDEGASYFQQMNLPQGQLKPSCCSADDLITISCPGTSTEAVSLLSPCKWTTNNVDITRSIGSVFAKTSHLSLPTSISGLRYRNVPDKRYNNDIRDTPGECKPCDTCEDEPVSDCNCYTHTQHDTQDFLNTRALAFTYIGEIQNLLPPWLQMFVNLELALESSPLTSYDFFAPITRPNDEVSSIEGCSKLTGLMNGIFSVLRYEKTLSAVIDGENFDYREDGDTGSSGDPMCFAVDLCHGSPVHIQMSQPINDILVSEYLDQFSSLQMHTVTLFNPMIPHSSTTQYWNGKEMVTPPEINIDISITTDAKLEFSDDSLQMSFDFSGSSMFDYKVNTQSYILLLCLPLNF